MTLLLMGTILVVFCCYYYKLLISKFCSYLKKIGFKNSDILYCLK